MEKNSQQSKLCVSAGGSKDVWSAQCGECFKWRVIPTLEEYEEIRSRFIEDPFICSKKPGCSCDQPADIEYNNSRTWVIDRPNIPKTPSGFRSRLAMRRDNSKFDCYYDLIEGRGKSFRAQTEVAKFLDENPEYKNDMSSADFCFSSPKVVADTIPVGIDNPVIPKTPRHKIRKTPLHNNPKQPLHDIAKSPHGFRKRLVPRKDNSRYDTYYDLIEEGVKGKRTFRSTVEIAKFLDKNPEYKKHVSLSDFSFNSPKTTGDTISRNQGYQA